MDFRFIIFTHLKEKLFLKFYPSTKKIKNFHLQLQYKLKFIVGAGEFNPEECHEIKATLFYFVRKYISIQYNTIPYLYTCYNITY